MEFSPLVFLCKPAACIDESHKAKYEWASYNTPHVHPGWKLVAYNNMTVEWALLDFCSNIPDFEEVCKRNLHKL